MIAAQSFKSVRVEHEASAVRRSVSGKLIHITLGEAVHSGVRSKRGQVAVRMNSHA